MKTKLSLLATFILSSFIAHANTTTKQSLQNMLSHFEVYKSPYSQKSQFYLTDKNLKQLETEVLNKLGHSWSSLPSNQNTSIPSLILSNKQHPQQKIWIGYKGEVTPQGKNMFTISTFSAQ
jgi:hypothetical protein